MDVDMLTLMKNCRIVLTDSGGLQEEATVPSIRKPVLILRSSTERPEAIETGFAKLVGVDGATALKVAVEVLENPPPLPDVSPFGDRKASERIVDVIQGYAESRAYHSTLRFP